MRGCHQRCAGSLAISAPGCSSTTGGPLLAGRPEIRAAGDNARMFQLDPFDALARHDVRYVVVGGLALNLHGEERATMDVDLVVALDAPNLGAAIDAFESIGLSPVAPVNIGEARDPETSRRRRREKYMIAFGLRPTRGVGPTVDCLIDPPSHSRVWRKTRSRNRSPTSGFPLRASTTSSRSNAPRDGRSISPTSKHSGA